MSTKEIQKTDKKTKEINVSDDPKNNEKWEEEGIENEEEDKKEKKEFSIGDTALARGETVQSWGAKNLEETISDEDSREDFESEDFEEEEEENSGFSYESTQEDGGDLYGETTSSGDLYGGRDTSVGDLYGATKREDSVSMYNTGGGSASESSLHNVGTTRRKNIIGVEYKIEGPKKKKSSVRKMPKSGLESGVKRKRRSKGVSLF